LLLALIISIGMFLLASMSSWRHSEVLGYALILVGSTIGIAIARSMDRNSLGASILGGAAGCAVLVGATAFLQPLLIHPEPGTAYKFGGGLGSAIGGLVLGVVFGGLSGSVVGLVAGLLRKVL
jgi:hypothetical protein